MDIEVERFYTAIRKLLVHINGCRGATILELCNRFRDVVSAADEVQACLDGARAKGRDETVERMRAAASPEVGDILFGKRPAARARPPVQAVTVTGWRAVLRVGPGVSLRDAARRYLELARRWHPDIPGGSADRMRELNAAIADARAELGGKGAL